MEIDIEKVCGKNPPEDVWEAIKRMSKAQQDIMDLVHTMNCILEFGWDENYHPKKLKEHVQKFNKEEPLTQLTETI